MKKGLFIILVASGAVAGGSFAYGWHSVTAIPQAAVTVSDTPTAAPIDELSAQASQTQQTLPVQFSKLVTTDATGQVKIALDAAQLTQLVNTAILEQPQAAPIFANARSVNTTFDGDRIETGAVINFAQLSQEQLPSDIKASLDQLTNIAPMLAERDIYLGIVGQPQIQDGYLTLDQDTTLKIGQFTLPLADVSEHVGISIGDIEQRLNAIVRQCDLRLETIDITDGQLVITGTRG